MAMSDLITNDEIDVLLHGITDGYDMINDLHSLISKHHNKTEEFKEKIGQILLRDDLTIEAKVKFCNSDNVKNLFRV